MINDFVHTVTLTPNLKYMRDIWCNNKPNRVIYSSEESNKKHPFPCPTTYRTALTHYLDITNSPRTNVLYELAQYASDPKDQENMRKMASSSPEGKVSASWKRIFHKPCFS